MNTLKKQKEKKRLATIYAYTGRLPEYHDLLIQEGAVDLFSSICQYEFEGKRPLGCPCPMQNQCQFAHTRQELKEGQRVEKLSMCLPVPSKEPTEEEESVEVQTKPVVTNQKKKKKLNTYKFCMTPCKTVYNEETDTWDHRGHDACRYGETCKFAHTEFEIRLGTALWFHMNPKNQEAVQEPVLEDPVFEAEPERLPEAEQLPMPLTYMRADSAKSFTAMNGGFGTPVGVHEMQLLNKDGSLTLINLPAITSVPLCSSLTSDDARELSPMPPSEDGMSDSGASWSSGTEQDQMSTSTHMFSPPIQPMTRSCSYPNGYLPVPCYSPSTSPGGSPQFGPTMSPASPTLLPIFQAPQILPVQSGGQFVHQQGLCQQQFLQPVHLVQQGPCMHGQFQEHEYLQPAQVHLPQMMSIATHL